MILLLFPVIVMLFLGGIYAWSMFVPLLQSDYGFTAAQTQWIFGAVIASFTLSMLFANMLVKKVGYKALLTISGILFSAGYLVASWFNGSFQSVFLGIGIVSGIGTGFGYMVSLAVSVQRFPNKKGLVTGIVSAGFGGGSVLLTYWVGQMLQSHYSVLDAFQLIGLGYGTIITLIGIFLPSSPQVAHNSTQKIEGPFFVIPLLFASMLMGTFGGLMVIGNLKLIGVGSFSDAQLSLAIVVFALANLSGRLFWGWLSDRFDNTVLLPMALIIQGVSIFYIGNYNMHVFLFYSMILLIGFGFGANFVLFAKEVMLIFGAPQMTLYYPIIFLGYGLSGILGPVTGGSLYDLNGDFMLASSISLALSALAGVVFVAAKVLSKKGMPALSFFAFKNRIMQ